jgi:asparagine synthase (glutamine-hydrolysing)
MCGIVGAYGAQPQRLEIALDRLAHRGPDGRAAIYIPNGVLGHARLAIIDVEGGRQPIADSSNTRWLVCNGEIYNHAALRADYPEYHFKTKSDSEVILPLYQWYGSEAVSLLDGMFAFAILDEQGVFLARDRLGKKPLYYGWADDTFFFASEIKALQGIVDSILEFPPGHWFRTDTGFVPYYDVVAVCNEVATRRVRPPTMTDIRISLGAAVRKRLMTDVPLGVFLSGGLDSSIIAALVCQDLHAVHSFAVGMAGSADLHYARLAALFLGTQHHEYVYTVDEMVAALPEVIYYLESFDPALVRSAVPNYFLARLASQHVKVVLSGEGADELYSGYEYLKPLGIGEQLQVELVTITSQLYNRNLQRLDRMTMAHGLEGRVPFLDPAFVELSFAVPLDLKCGETQGIEKWILRKAFEDLLPPEIVWRAKQKFSTGAGSAHVFEGLAEDEISQGEFVRETHQVLEETGYQIQSKEELYYYRVFRTFFDASITALVGHSRSL